MADSKIVDHRVHVLKIATEAVDKLRRQEFLWVNSRENLSDRQRTFFKEIDTTELQPGKAWANKEMLRDLWCQDTVSAATDYFNAWYRILIRTQLGPMNKVAQTIKDRLANVVSYCTLGITNAVAEGINSKIQPVKRRVGGYRNQENFKTAIFFYCGGLDLYLR